MAYNAIQDNIYNYYLTAYTPKNAGKYDAHKRSELRGIYNSIIKLNKESPLYLLSNRREAGQFAMGLKENARELNMEIASLGGNLNSQELLERKAAYSSNEDLVTAKFIGDSSNSDFIKPINIEVQSLASNQVNLGNFLEDDSLVALPPDTYSFDIGINDMNYEFQFSIHEGETNRNILNRLARLIDGAGIGLGAEVIEGEENTSSLRIESDATGLKSGRNRIFSVSDDNTSKASGIVSYLGLDYVAREGSNARFTINGKTSEAHSNKFTLDKSYEVELHGISSEESGSAEIGLRVDYEALADNVTLLAGSYNSFLSAMDQFKTAQNSSAKLKGEMAGIASLYKENLLDIGLNVQDDGRIDVDRDALSGAIHSGDAENRFQVVKNFTQQIFRKTNQISLNPMKYVDKTVVAYKNPGHNFPAPYVSSNYTGMLFNYYC
ncbi:MAG: flagellar capping protein [Lachnospiraceae bacterium]|nr:flagellar capping protein [Lachnospiraceae bacterium]